MNEHLQSLLERNQYSEELKEQAVLRVLFGGEDPYDVCQALDIHNVFAVNNWVNTYRKKIESGLITLPPMSEKQKADLQALRQRNKELERSLKDANLMIHALNSLIDVAEKELKTPIRKKRGTKRS
ncbi:MAG: transposase [Chitinophagaceae bacterium]|nr:transposase [Chitinophagaceae bacterium]